MRLLKIGEKEYKIEFTVEASLYKECTEKVSSLMMDITNASQKEDIKKVICSMSDIPQTTLIMFYAGLLEHHGEDGDGSVTSVNDAKKLIKQYFAEHSEDETGNFYGVMEILVEQMGEDGFFKQIGLEQLIQQTENTTKKAKQPQDHKKKATKVTEK